MPFTFAHPSAVLPLKKFFKNKVSLTGLIIGSVVPDFEYFLHLASYSAVSHTVKGIWMFNLPATFIIAFAYHIIVKQPLISNIPFDFRKRFYSAAHFDWLHYFRKHYIVFTISALIGIITHLVWDSFSHTTGYLARNSELLQTQIIYNGYHIYSLIWLVSTVAGSWYVWSYIRRFNDEDLKGVMRNDAGADKNFWAWIFFVVSIIIILKYLPITHPRKFRDVVISIIGATIMATFIVSVFYQVKRTRVKDR